METAMKIILPAVVVIIVVMAFGKYFGGEAFYTAITDFFAGIMEKANSIYMSTP